MILFFFKFKCKQDFLQQYEHEINKMDRLYWLPDESTYHISEKNNPLLDSSRVYIRRLLLTIRIISNFGIEQCYLFKPTQFSSIQIHYIFMKKSIQKEIRMLVDRWITHYKCNYCNHKYSKVLDNYNSNLAYCERCNEANLPYMQVILKIGL